LAQGILVLALGASVSKSTDMPSNSSAADGPTRRAGRPGGSTKRDGRAAGLSAPKLLKKRRLGSRVKGQLSSKRRKAKRAVPKKSNADSTEHICPICQDEYSASTFPVVHAPCGHVACAHCSLKWQQKAGGPRTCALCRTPVLSVAHCPLLEQLIVASPDTAKQESMVGIADPTTTTSAHEEQATRETTIRALKELSQGDINDVPGDYRKHIVHEVLVRAIRKGDLTMLEKCLKQFKGRASTNMLCELAEHWRNKGQQHAALSLMLAHGGRVNGHCEQRPLHCAAAQGNAPMMSVLLELKADPLITCGPGGETALHIAARCGRFEAVRELLDAGVPADIKDAQARTPLSIAMRGKECHAQNCHDRVQGWECKRCEARIQTYGELRWRVERSGKADNARAEAAQRINAAPENDEESEASTSEASDDDYSVSDMGDWYEDPEEEGEAEYVEDEEEEEEGGDDERASVESEDRS